MKKVKRFKTGRRQDVSLPAEFRCEGGEVRRRISETDDRVLSQRRGWSNWDDFFGARDARLVPNEFLSDRHDKEPQIRKLFGQPLTTR